MRWKAIYLLLAVLTLLGIFVVFFLDSFLGWTIENSLQTVTGAKVEVKQLHLDLLNLKISIGNLQVTNPKDTWRNLVETQNITFQMATEPIYSGKIVIEEVAIEDLMINTPRKTDGKIKTLRLPGPLGQAQVKLNNDIAALPVLDPNNIQNPIDTDKMFNSYQMKTDFSTVVIHNHIEEANRNWQTNLQKLAATQSEIQELQQKFTEFQASEPRNILEIRDKLQKLQELEKSGATIQQTITQTNSNLKNDFKSLRDNVAGLKEAAEADYQSLLKLAKLPDFESLNIAEVLFGKALLNESSFALDMVDNLQKQIPVKFENPPREVHPRGGQDITFPGHKTYPRFLIKHVSISTKGTPASVLAGYSAKGSAMGITSEPQLYGSPMLLKISGQAPNNAFLEFNGSLNHLSPAINDQLDLKMGNIPLPEFKLSDSSLLPTKISSGSAYISAAVNIKADSFNLDMTFEGRNLVCDYSDKSASSDLITQIIRETLAKVDLVAIRYQLVSVSKKLRMNISSNVDQIINARIKAVIGAKIEEATKTIRQRVDEELQKNQKELDSLCNKYQTELSANINQVQTILNQEKQKVEKAKQDLESKAKQQIQLPQLPQLPKFK